MFPFNKENKLLKICISRKSEVGDFKITQSEKYEFEYQVKYKEC